MRRAGPLSLSQDMRLKAGFLRSKTEGSGSAKMQRHSGPFVKKPVGFFDQSPAGATPYRRFSARPHLPQVAGAGCARVLTLNAHIAFAFCTTHPPVKGIRRHLARLGCWPSSRISPTIVCAAAIR